MSLLNPKISSITKRTENSPVYQGDIFYITNDPDQPTVGCEMWVPRPGVIVSNDSFNKYSTTVDVVFLTTSNNKKGRCGKNVKQVMTHVPVISYNSRQCYAICEQVTSISKNRFTHYMGTVTDEEMQHIKDGMLFALGIGLDETPKNLFRKWENKVRKNKYFTKYDKFIPETDTGNQEDETINTSEI